MPWCWGMFTLVWLSTTLMGAVLLMGYSSMLTYKIGQVFLQEWMKTFCMFLGVGQNVHERYVIPRSLLTYDITLVVLVPRYFLFLSFVSFVNFYSKGVLSFISNLQCCTSYGYHLTKFCDWFVTSFWHLFNNFPMAFIASGQSKCENCERRSCHMLQSQFGAWQLCLSQLSHFDWSVETEATRKLSTRCHKVVKN